MAGKTDYYALDYDALFARLKTDEREFCAFVEAGQSHTQAAVNAFGINNKNVAAVKAHRLLNSDKIRAYTRARAKFLRECYPDEADDIINTLRAVTRQCMEGTPHLSWDAEEHAYMPDGTFTFDSLGATKALELRGKAIGLYVDKTDAVVRGGNVEDYLSKLDEDGHSGGFGDAVDESGGDQDGGGIGHD